MLAFNLDPATYNSQSPDVVWDRYDLYSPSQVWFNLHLVFSTGLKLPPFKERFSGVNLRPSHHDQRGDGLTLLPTPIPHASSALATAPFQNNRRINHKHTPWRSPGLGAAAIPTICESLAQASCFRLRLQHTHPYYCSRPSHCCRNQSDSDLRSQQSSNLSSGRFHNFLDQGYPIGYWSLSKSKSNTHFGCLICLTRPLQVMRESINEPMSWTRCVQLRDVSNLLCWGILGPGLGKIALDSSGLSKVPGEMCPPRLTLNWSPLGLQQLFPPKTHSCWLDNTINISISYLDSFPLHFREVMQLD